MSRSIVCVYPENSPSASLAVWIITTAVLESAAYDAGELIVEYRPVANSRQMPSRIVDQDVILIGLDYLPSILFMFTTQCRSVLLIGNDSDPAAGMGEPQAWSHRLAAITDHALHQAGRRNVKLSVSSIGALPQIVWQYFFRSTSRQSVPEYLHQVQSSNDDIWVFRVDRVDGKQTITDILQPNVFATWDLLYLTETKQQVLSSGMDRGGYDVETEVHVLGDVMYLILPKTKLRIATYDIPAACCPLDLAPELANRLATNTVGFAGLYRDCEIRIIQLFSSATGPQALRLGMLYQTCSQTINPNHITLFKPRGWVGD